MGSKEIFVWIALGNENHFVGKLWCHARRGRETSSFEYDMKWLDHPERFALEPALKLIPGTYHTQADQNLFGAIGDSAPDRWGRVLMRRAHSQNAQSKGLIPSTLTEADYLLGVNDEARQGALRFSENPDGPFLSDKKAAIPPLVDLPKLLSATERFLNDDESAKDLKLLLAPGSSLGGARPKASVRDKDGSLAIAKFPKKDDEFNIVIWEAVALELAKKAKIQTPKWRLEYILDKPVIIISRFDRVNQQRIPFLSAMSMLGARDNEQHSYLEIVEALSQFGAYPNADMEELWRRLVFNILISNTDDHLRNHGFMYVRYEGWKLSPSYDLNPTPVEVKPRILTTTINYDDSTASLDLALSVIGHFRISMEQARAIIREVSKAVTQFRQVARNFRISENEINRMATAFEHADLEKALKI